MTLPLLKTKLHIPPVRAGAVSRPHLVERLNQSLHLGHRLVLISAPAGFGKTTLLSEWITGQNLLAGWVSLDERDNDPARFLSYLAAALQEVLQEKLGPAAQALPPPDEQDAFLSEWINRLHALSGDLLLVLDDYHLVVSERVHEAMTFLLDYAPRNFHLVIASRADPPLPVARLRGRGQITELRQHDLQFTAEECATFLEQRLDCDLSDRDVDALTARTEGWIAGLQMAVQSLRGRARPSDLVQQFAGSHRFILDYLIEEVLSGEPAHVQRFLLHTSVLDQLCGPLCDAILGPEDREQMNAQAVLEYLEHANLFVVPLDDRREWYRYHRLFADLLRYRLDRTEPDRVPVLHHQASCWYQAHDMYAEAIDHALQGQDLEWAADLIEQHAGDTALRGQLATLCRWVESLPIDLALARPSLYASYALVCLLSGRPIDAIATNLFALEGDDTTSGSALLFRGLTAMMRGEISEGEDLSREALAHLPAENRFARGLALSILESVETDRAAALAQEEPSDRHAEMPHQTGEVMIALTTKHGRAEMHQRQGHLRQAYRIYQDAVVLATTSSGKRLPVAGQALIGIADLLREWNRLDDALHYAREGITLSRQWSRIATVEAYMAMSRIQQARDDLPAALESLRQARDVAVQVDVSDIYAHTVSLYEARLSIAQNNPGPAWQWVRVNHLDAYIGQQQIVEDPNSVRERLRKYELIALARILLSQERWAEALSVLGAVLPVAQRRNRPALVIEIYTLQALAYHASGDLDQALQALERALSLAEPEGYVRVLLDEGQPLLALLREAVRHDVAAPYARTLIAASRATPPEKPATQDGLVEELTDREFSILRLLNGPLSSTEIAEELVISANTVRYHIKNIYGKLGAHSRSEAVDRAQKLGLL